MNKQYLSLFGLVMAIASPPRAISAQNNSFRVVHYNIRELDCAKLSKAEAHLASIPQIKEAVEIIKGLRPDILSINEMQYDRHHQHTRACSTAPGEFGQNIKRLARLLTMPENTAFLGEANTGALARPKGNGEYASSPDDLGARNLADPINFGIFPGQYATGFLSKHPAHLGFFNHDLVWKEFNPEVNLTKFIYLDRRENSSGVERKFDPKIYQLFDKSFTDMVVQVEGRPVHVILLHTIVGGNFGNDIPDENSPNELRNAEQLAFLEWYLTGETTLNGKKLNSLQIQQISPLPPGTPFIALGDWNVDVDKNPEKPGAKILKSLFAKAQRWFKYYQPTQETWNFKPTTKPSQLDYMVVSNHFEIVASGGYYPEANKVKVGTCGGAKPEATSSTRVVAEYKNQEKKTCYVEVNQDYFRARVASDHYPIWAELKFK